MTRNVVTSEVRKRFNQISKYLYEKLSIGLLEDVWVTPATKLYKYHSRSYHLFALTDKYLGMTIQGLAYAHYLGQLVPADVTLNLYAPRYEFASRTTEEPITKEDIPSMTVFLSRTKKGVWER